MQAGWDKFIAPMYGEYSATTNALASAIMVNVGNNTSGNVNLYGHSWGSITTRNVESVLVANGYRNAGMQVRVFGPAVGGWRNRCAFDDNHWKRCSWRKRIG